MNTPDETSNSSHEEIPALIYNHFQNPGAPKEFYWKNESPDAKWTRLHFYSSGVSLVKLEEPGPGKFHSNSKLLSGEVCWAISNQVCSAGFFQDVEFSRFPFLLIIFVSPFVRMLRNASLINPQDFTSSSDCLMQVGNSLARAGEPKQKTQAVCSLSLASPFFLRQYLFKFSILRFMVNAFNERCRVVLFCLFVCSAPGKW